VNDLRPETAAFSDQGHQPERWRFGGTEGDYRDPARLQPLFKEFTTAKRQHSDFDARPP
jgi:hypothetical protein